MSLILHLKSEFPGREFQALNIVQHALPKVDLILWRDLFIHLTNKDINSAIKNINASKIQYLANTAFTNRAIKRNLPIFTRGIPWRTINHELQPFNFPQPQVLIDENCTGGSEMFFDKAVAIWKISCLP